MPTNRKNTPTDCRGQPKPAASGLESPEDEDHHRQQGGDPGEGGPDEDQRGPEAAEGTAAKHACQRHAGKNAC